MTSVTPFANCPGLKIAQEFIDQSRMKDAIYLGSREFDESEISKVFRVNADDLVALGQTIASEPLQPFLVNPAQEALPYPGLEQIGERDEPVPWIPSDLLDIGTEK